MFNLGWLEVSLILLAAILVFGPKKIPELGGTIGKTLRGFKEELNPDHQQPDDENEREEQGR